MGNLTLLSFSEPLTHGIWVIDSGNILLSEPSALQA